MHNYPGTVIALGPGLLNVRVNSTVGNTGHVPYVRGSALILEKIINHTWLSYGLDQVLTEIRRDGGQTSRRGELCADPYALQIPTSHLPVACNEPRVWTIQFSPWNLGL